MITRVVVKNKSYWVENGLTITEDCQSYDCDVKRCRAGKGECCQHCNKRYEHRDDPAIIYVKSRIGA